MRTTDALKKNAQDRNEQNITSEVSAIEAEFRLFQKGFEEGNLNINRSFKIFEISAVPGETKKRGFCSQGTYKVQNFIVRTSISYYSMAEGIYISDIKYKIYLLEREQWLSEVLRKHQSSVIYSFTFIYSEMCEIDKNVHSILKRGDYKAEILRVLSLLGEKFIFFQVPWDERNF